MQHSNEARKADVQLLSESGSCITKLDLLYEHLFDL